MIRFTCLSALALSCSAAIAQVNVQTPAQPAQSSASSGATSTTSTDITLFQKIEDNWANAVNQHDQYGLENVLSPLFVDVAASGDITTRNQQIVQVINGDDKTIWLTQKVITVRMLGDIAVANGTYTLHHKVNTLQVDEKGVFTHVFERLRGGWACINSQRTALKPDNSNPKKAKASSSEPFHIPLFSKGDKGPQP